MQGSHHLSMAHFSMKIKNLIISLIIIFTGSSLFCIVVDPYSVFHYDAIRCHSGDPNSRYVKIKYIVNNPDKFNSFIFGSSRVGYIHVDQLNDEEDTWYNMTYSNAGVSDSLYSLKLLIENGIIPKNVMIGIDGVDSKDPFRFDGDLLRTQYPNDFFHALSFYRLYLNPSVSTEALLTLDWKDAQETSIIREQYYEKGYDIVNGTPNFSYNKDNLNIVAPKTVLDDTVNESLDVIRELVAICEKYDINLILFTTPIHYSYYVNEVGRGYILYIREIAKMHDIYCFAGLNDICMNDANYWEEVHFTEEVGNEIMSVIFDGKLVEGFGVNVFITKANADDYYKNAMERYSEVFLGD